MSHQLTPDNDYGIFRCGERNINSKLHKLDVYLIREFIKEGRTQQYIADMFKINQKSVSQINTKKTWGWLE